MNRNIQQQPPPAQTQKILIYISLVFRKIQKPMSYCPTIMLALKNSIQTNCGTVFIIILI